MAHSTSLHCSAGHIDQQQLRPGREVGGEIAGQPMVQEIGDPEEADGGGVDVRAVLAEPADLGQR